MSLRIIISVCLALAAAVASAADAPAVIRIERAKLLSKLSQDWLLRTPDDCYFVLRFKIDTKGRAADISVADRGFSNRDQIRSAMAYVRDLKFKPASRNGEPVETAMSLTFSVSKNTGSSVSPRFKEESQKVLGMITAGDFEGASNHAEWMLSEVVRTSAEYLGFQGTMAQAFASAGRVHSAILALRSATARAKSPPKLVLGAPIPRNEGANYQFNNPQYIANLLDLRLRLTVQQGLLMEALWTYRDLAGLIPMKPDDPRVALAAQLTAALRSDAPLVGKLKIVVPAPGYEARWSQPLWRRHFTLDGVRGKVTRIALSCDDQSRELVYGEGVEWSVPESWEDCAVHIYGDEGTELQMVEFADDQNAR